jgi:hypothetical protein
MRRRSSWLRSLPPQPSPPTITTTAPARSAVTSRKFGGSTSGWRWIGFVAIKRLARKIEQVLNTIAGTSSAYAERIIGVITSTSPLTGSHTFGLAWPRNAAGTTLPRVGAMVW